MNWYPANVIAIDDKTVTIDVPGDRIRLHNVAKAGSLKPRDNLEAEMASEFDGIPSRVRMPDGDVIWRYANGIGITLQDP